MGGFDFAYWNAELEGTGNKMGLYDQYLLQFPSERIDGDTTYYNISDDYDGNGSINGQPLSYYN